MNSPMDHSILEQTKAFCCLASSKDERLVDAVWCTMRKVAKFAV